MNIENLFWVSSFIIIYNYALYPVIIILLSKFYQREHVSSSINDDDLPSVSFIIAAFNEERVIEDKIKNSLKLIYPKDKLEIIVVSDGSDDNTETLVKAFDENNVISLHDKPRKGKSSALNRAAEYAHGEILILSDANNLFNDNACIELVKHFSNNSIGGVTGLKQIVDDSTRDSTEGDSLYWKYESRIKQAESDVKTITNADGEIFAIRKSLYEAIPVDVINDDAELTFSLRRQGYTIRYEMQAISSEKASINIVDDYFVKVRMVSGAYQTMAKHWKALFSPFDIFSYMFISHKILRWLVPFFMIIAYVSNALLLNDIIYVILFILQSLFYVTALYGVLKKDKTNLPSIIYIPYYFCYMNAAALHGFVRFLSNKQSVSWRKAAR